MNRVFVVFMVSMCGPVSMSIFASDAHAQPILRRVEQFLRSELDAAQNPADAEPGFLGVVVDDAQEQGRGVRIVEVTPDGPGSKAGLKTADLITAINGRQVRSLDEMAPLVERMLSGSKLTLTVNRNGTELQQDVTLGKTPRLGPADLPVVLPGELPAPGPVIPPQGPVLGIRTVPVTEDVRQQNNLPDMAGALVVSVTTGSPADRAGVRVGAVITAIDKQVIHAPQELAAAIRSAGPREIELGYRYRGQDVTKSIMLAGSKLSNDRPQPQVRARPLAGAPAPAPSGDSTPDGPRLDGPQVDRTTTLEARLQELEERIKKLEAALAREPK